MKITDTRLSALEKDILSSLIGKTLNSYSHNENKISNIAESAWGIVGLKVDEKTYLITLDTECKEIFGEEDDVPVLHIAESETGEVDLRVLSSRNISYKVGRTIKDITLFEDEQILLLDSGDRCGYAFVSAIAFQFENSQLVFETNGWLTEEFLIHKGRNAEKNVPTAIDLIPEEDRERMKTSRRVTNLKDL